MQNKLQELTEKIYKEGLTKGTEEANQIVSKAKDDAAQIIADAKKQAEQIVAQAKKESEDLKKNVETEVGISARQVVSGLKQDIANLLEAKVIETPLIEALKDTNFIKGIIEAAIKNWDPNSNEKIALQVLLPESNEKELKGYLSDKVIATLNKDFEVVADKNLKYGFKIGPKDGSYVISFSDKDFENLFREYMRPRILEMLFGGK
ncbi:V-type ATP synthase subunit E [Perlabentimonas gracilis]|uniref:V-type ATP synthase subunit E n=1 Tax=Perlabentimonas gracilis TaxID=2715279 RepID=UPI00140D8BA1|nr:V-type ATP synthase subunit E [Perlabentimonas gracilis]NHB68527.1 V-type ATP synthase subunit E [Perlabentimonas gracilis]